METKIYAAYGSNMNIEQMRQRCPKAKVIGKGELKGYRLTFRGKGAGVANVERSEQDGVPIVLWTITPECEIALDRYEGYPTLYVKETVEIKTDVGELPAMLYVMAKQYEKMPALPNEYYLSVIWQGYLENDIDAAPLLVAVETTQFEMKL